MARVLILLHALRFSFESRKVRGVNLSIRRSDFLASAKERFVLPDKSSLVYHLTLKNVPRWGVENSRLAGSFFTLEKSFCLAAKNR